MAGPVGECDEEVISPLPNGGCPTDSRPTANSWCFELEVGQIDFSFFELLLSEPLSALSALYVLIAFNFANRQS